MNIENYYNFVKIVEAGTISAASRELMIAQPALSLQLKSLEEEYGVQLLTRGARHIHLTDAGKVVYENAKKMILIEDTMHKDIDLQIEGKRGILHIGICPFHGEPSVSKPLQAFCAEYPEMDFDIYEESSAYILDRLKNGEVELGIVHLSEEIPSNFQVLFSIPEHFLVAFNENNPWIDAKKEIIPLLSLQDVPLGVTRGVRGKVINCCLKTGFMPKIHSISTSRTLSLTWAADGKCVAVFPTSSPEEELQYRDLKYRPLTGSGLSSTRSFVALQGRELSPAARSFLKYTKEYFETKQNLK